MSCFVKKYINPENAFEIYYAFEKGSTCCFSKNSFGIKIFQYSSTKTALRALPVKLFHCLTTISNAFSGIKIHFFLDPFIILLCLLTIFTSLLFIFPGKIIAASPGVMVVRKIKIRGNFPIFEKELRRLINIRIGEEYSPDKAKEVAQKIENAFKEEGFEKATVEIHIKQEDETPQGIIIFVINKGPRMLISKVEIIDDRPQEKPDVRRILGLREGQLFKEKKLKERIKFLEGQLVRHGYLKADVRYIKKNPDSGVRLDFFIYRGSRVDVGIEGNRHFSQDRIKDVLSFYENRFFDKWEVDESLQGIKELYLDQGFLDVQVNAEWAEEEIEPGEFGDKYVVFKIIEGNRTYIKDIIFKNNRHIKAKRLKRQLLSIGSLSMFFPRPFKALTFAEDLKAIEALYWAEGFPNVQIKTETIKHAEDYISKKITFEEGIRLVVKRLAFSGNKAFPDRDLKRVVSLNQGSPLYPKALEDDKRELGAFYANNGYPYARISVKMDKGGDSGLVDLEYGIEEGPFVRFGKILINRNIKTREKVIRLGCVFKEGEPFSYKKVIDTQERLSDLGIFRSLSIDLKGIEQRKEAIDSIIEVEEMETGQLNFGAGFSSRVGYRGYVELREDNIGGKGISGGIKADYSGLGKRYTFGEEAGRSSSYTITFRHPLLMPRHKLEGEGKLYTATEDRREYHTRGYGLQFGIWRPYKRRHLRVGITYHIDLTSLKDITLDSIPEKYEPHVISAIGPTIIYDSRDNFMDPRRGIYGILSFDWAGGWVGGDKNFYKIQTECRVFLPLSSRLVMAISVRGGHIGLYSNTHEAPIQERFFAEGSNTVRGFKEDSLVQKDEDTGLSSGGHFYWFNNIEFRYPLYKTLKGVVFFDTGYVWRRKQEVDIRDLRQGAGIGLRWITPIGPVRIDYGIPIDREDKEPSSRAYLSIGHAF